MKRVRRPVFLINETRGKSNIVRLQSRAIKVRNLPLLTTTILHHLNLTRSLNEILADSSLFQHPISMENFKNGDPFEYQRRVSNQVNRTKENIDTKEFFFIAANRSNLRSDGQHTEAADLSVFNTFQTSRYHLP